MLRLTLRTLYRQTSAEVAVQSARVFGPDDVFAKQACADLIGRQSMAGTVDDYLPGYKEEVCNILRRRMTLQDPKQAYNRFFIVKPHPSCLSDLDCVVVLQHPPLTTLGTMALV